VYVTRCTSDFTQIHSIKVRGKSFTLKVELEDHQCINSQVFYSDIDCCRLTFETHPEIHKTFKVSDSHSRSDPTPYLDPSVILLFNI